MTYEEEIQYLCDNIDLLDSYMCDGYDYEAAALKVLEKAE